MTPRERTREILATVAAYYSLTPAILLSRKRHRHIALARHVAMYVASVNVECKWHLSRIGEYFGRDHTSVAFALNKVRDLVDFHSTGYDAELAAQVRILIEATKSEPVIPGAFEKCASEATGAKILI